MTTECIADAKGSYRIRKLQERSKHIDDQIAELTDKKECIDHEIQQLKGELNVQ